MKAFLCFFLMAVTTASAFAKSEAPKKLSEFKCEEWDMDTEEVFARISVKLDHFGLASEVKVDRIKTENEPAFQLSFALGKTLISHDVRPGQLTGWDEETKEPMFNFGVRRVETIEATNAAGDRITLALNDHNYSGTPGSSVSYKRQGREVKTNYAVRCEGPFRLSWGSDRP